MLNPVDRIGEEKITQMLQVKQIEMLKEIKGIFEKNNIPFFLACGTALGCARHSGFIPWDDDVDIYVFGSDYERIKHAINNEPNSLLRFQDVSSDSKYPYWFPKIVASDTVLVEKELASNASSCGVYIDVFPLFSVADNVFLRKVKEFIRYYRYVAIRAYYNDSFSRGSRRIVKQLAQWFVNPVNLQKKLIKTYEQGISDTRFVIDPGVFHNNALLKSNWFHKIVYMKFESELMPMPAGYHDYLTDYYGDYMKLPHEDQRVSRHHIVKLEIPGVKELVE